MHSDTDKATKTRKDRSEKTDTDLIGSCRAAESVFLIQSALSVCLPLSLSLSLLLSLSLSETPSPLGSSQLLWVVLRK